MKVFLSMETKMKECWNLLKAKVLKLLSILLENMVLQKWDLDMTSGGGFYYIVGYGEEIKILAVDVIISEKNIIGNLVGTWSELYELMELANKGLVKLSMQEYKLGDANKALHDLNEGKVKGRAVLVP